jgi:hypothetical protein
MHIPIANTLFSFVGNAVFFTIVYFTGRSEPVAIGMFIYSFGYGCINALVAIALLFFRCSPAKVIHSWVTFATAVFIYYLYELIQQSTSGNSVKFNSLHLIVLIGSVLFCILLTRTVWMLLSYSKKKGNTFDLN